VLILLVTIKAPCNRLAAECLSDMPLITASFKGTGLKTAVGRGKQASFFAWCSRVCSHLSDVNESPSQILKQLEVVFNSTSQPGIALVSSCQTSSDWRSLVEIWVPGPGLRALIHDPTNRSVLILAGGCPSDPFTWVSRPAKCRFRGWLTCNGA